MTKAEIASAVNEWFNIENYSVLQNLTVEQLFQEIENRIVAYRMEKNGLSCLLKTLVGIRNITKS